MRSNKILTVALMLILITLAACQGKKDTDEKEKEGTPQAQRQTAYTVTVDENAQQADGMETEAIQTYVYRQQTSAYGQVLSPAGLASAYNNLATAKSSLQKFEAQLMASRLEYARLKSLNASNKNVSDRALQAAEAKYLSDKAEVAGARGALRTAKDAISTGWGPVISGWISGYNESLQNVIGSRDVLVQLAIPPTSKFKTTPKRVQITSPAGVLIPANFVSGATSANPSIQGISFIYIASSRSGNLLPGMNVTANMPSAGTQSGFLVPSAAVVWLQDKAWVYVKKSAAGFNRVEIPTSTPVDEGYFVSGVFSPGDQIVVKGAQALMSAESTPKAEGGGGEDEDDDD